MAVHALNTASNVLGDDVVSRRLRSLLLQGAGAMVPRSTSLHGGTYFSRPSNLRFGRGCFVNRRCYLDSESPITFGDDVSVGHGVTIITTAHETGPPTRRAGRGRGRPVELASGVWLGANCTILPGVTVGAGSIVAAGAVVTRDVPANVVVAGVPAKVIRRLGDGFSPG